MNDEMIVDQTEDGRYRVRLEHDTDAPNPRRDGDYHLTHVVTVPDWNWEDVDQDGGPLADGWDRIKDRSDAMDVFERWARTFHGAAVDRLTLHDGPSSVWYLMPEQAKELGSSVTPEQALQAEMREYTSWREGDTYGYVIEKTTTWQNVDSGDRRDEWEEVDSCWGFIGDKYATESAKEAFAAYKEENAE